MESKAEHTRTLYQDILRRLNLVRKKKHRVAVVYGVAACGVAALLLALGAVLLEQIFFFAAVGRTLLFLGTALGLAAGTGWFVGRPLGRMVGLLPSEDNPTLSLLVGKHFPHLKDRLLNALQVFESRNDAAVRYSSELVDAAFAELYLAIQPLEFSEAVDTSRIRHLKKFAAYAAAVFFLVFVISPTSFLDSAWRIVRFNQTFASPLPIQFVLEPGNIEVVRGATVPLTIHTQGRPVPKVVLRLRQQGQVDFESRELQSTERVFHDSILNIKSTTEYFAEAGDIKSEKFKITVVDRPLIRSFRVQLQYPAYTRLVPKTLDENIGDVSSYKGTLIALEISSSKDLSSASLVFSDSSVLPMIVGGKNATVRFHLDAEKSYHLFLEDEENLTSADPIEYQLKLIPDAFPTAALLVPAKNVDATEQMQLDILARIADDFGFSKLRLAHRLIQSRYESPSAEFSYLDIPLASKDQTPQEIWYRWNLTGLHLVPEDIVAYYVEVFDNDNVSGPKSASSETFLIRLPSLDEVFRDVAQTQTQSMESMQSVRDDLRNLKKQMDEMRNEMKKENEKADWQRQRKAEEMLKKFEELKKMLDETAQKLEQNLQKMEENKMLSKETLEKYRELQKLMEELNAPELQQALKKLQEAMKQLSPDQIREAMQKLQMTEEMFRKSLERTIELLKRIAIEQKLDELLRRTEEMMRQQEELRKQTGEAKTSDQKRLDELARQQQDLQKQLAALEKELGDLVKKMDEFPADMPLREIEKAQHELDEQELGEQMRNASQQVQFGETQRARGSQRKISQGLQKFHEQLQAAQESLRENQQRQVMNELRKALQNMLELSKRQEGLKDETQNFDPNSQRFRQSAGMQMQILGDLANVANSLTQLSRKTFAVSPEMGREIGKALQEMGQAMQSMEQRNPSATAQSQGKAMGALNRTAMMMQGAMNAMMQAGGSMGMAGLMQQLQAAAGGQVGINAQTQSLMGEGEGINPQQAAEWNRLAGEQAAVRKSLEELAHEAEQTGELSRLLGDLNKIAEEMHEVQTDMEQNNVNTETVKKQERIVSRLLDSQRSMRERDYEKRRRAEAGKNVLRSGPAQIDLTTQEGRGKLRQELLKALEERYSRDYEELIRKYFEQLEKVEIKQ